MGTHRKRLLHDLPTLETLLGGEARVDSHDLMSSILSFGFKDIEERAPTGIHNGFRQVVVLDHPTDVEIFYCNMMVLFGVLLCRLEMEVTALTVDLEMGLCRATCHFRASVTALFAAAQCPLLASECLLRRAIEARVLNRMALAIGQERLQADINADVRMGTFRWKMLGLWKRLAHDESVPMPIRTQNQMHGLGCSFYRTMQFDLEGLAHLFGENEMLLILMQRDIFAVLPQLERVPLVALLEAGEAHIRDVILPGRKKPLEGFREAIGKHLNAGSRNMFALSLESLFQIILAWKRTFLFILCLDGLKHPIVNGARLLQALHEQLGLLLIHEQAILKCFHAGILLQAIRNVKWMGSRRRTGGNSPLCLKSGAFLPLMVELSM